MTTRTGIITLALLVALVGGYIAFAQYTPSSINPFNDPNVSVSNEDDAAIRAMVEEWATKFRNVSLLAPDAGAQIAAQYGPYVSQSLIAQWQSDPSQAPGRRTSSPWPESAYVLEVVQEGSGYRVEANVIEITNAEPREPAAVQPITLHVEKENGRWMVTSFERGAYSTLPQRATVDGFITCLPHKDTTGPQTDECAIGLAIDQSDGFYALDTRLMSTYPIDFPTGTKVRVEGVITPANQLSSVQKYNIDGILSATSIMKI